MLAALYKQLSKVSYLGKLVMYSTATYSGELRKVSLWNVKNIRNLRALLFPIRNWKLEVMKSLD